MKLDKLFEMQRVLDERIEKEHPREDGEDRLAKKILALQVELGELANEWRGFKFWSKDQEPRTKPYMCKVCDEYEVGWKGASNPLLEEYVDGLHFFLSIGNELQVNTHPEFELNTTKNIMTLFAKINRYVAVLWWENHDNTNDKGIKWLFAFTHFMTLGIELGFTWEQIEQAYISKNEVNHERQENGY